MELLLLCVVAIGRARMADLRRDVKGTILERL